MVQLLPSKSPCFEDNFTKAMPANAAVRWLMVIECYLFLSSAKHSIYWVQTKGNSRYLIHVL